jgi:hypothetical protein
MTFALKELARLLAPQETRLGVVVALEGKQVRVASERGVMTVQAIDALAVGERVLVRSGLATRAPSALQSYPV